MAQQDEPPPSAFDDETQGLRMLEEVRLLRESERRFRALIEKATDVLYVVDAEMFVRFWSPGAEAALGWTAAEALGRQGLDLIHPDDLASITPPPPDAPLGSSVHLVFRVQHRDGGWRYLDATVRNLLADPAIRGIIVNARDITEQRLREERSAESTRLESLGRLAGGVAHDFNNLLTVILNCSEFALEAMRDGSPPREDDLREILGAGIRARDLTRQLLAFARRQVIEPVVLDLNALLAGSKGMLRRLVREDISLVFRATPEPCPVRCDPSQLQQVLLNLIVNARDAMPHGGSIDISTQVSLEDQRRWARLRVADSGTGIPDEIRAHIFEPFFSTKPQGRGTGLGLATVHGIVSQSGGSVSVESEPGRGSCFEISLPICDEAPAPAPAPPQAARRVASEVVLLVEDEEAVRAVALRILRGAGYQVLPAARGSEAVAIAGKTPRVDLLLTDVVMPGLDGRQVIESLRRLHPRARVLMMSGHPLDVLGRYGVLDDTYPLLSKPFSAASLLARVAEVLAQPGARPEALVPLPARAARRRSIAGVGSRSAPSNSRGPREPRARPRGADARETPLKPRSPGAAGPSSAGGARATGRALAG